MTQSPPCQTKSNAPLVACPRCGTRAPYSPNNEFRPFCSKRCKNTDFIAWIEEDYAIPAPASEEDLAEAQEGETPSEHPHDEDQGD